MVVNPSKGPRSGAAKNTLSCPVYVMSDPNPPKMALGTQLAGTLAWHMSPVRPDLSSDVPLTTPLPIKVIPSVTGAGLSTGVERVVVVTARTANAVLKRRIMGNAPFRDVGP